MSVLLGLDVGERRIGLALGDDVGVRVTGLTTIRRADAARDAATLTRLVHEHAVTELVIGLPLLTDGSEGSQAQATRAWAAEVVPLVGLPVSWRDERYTSVDAERRLGRVGHGRSGGPPSSAARSAYRARIDREAAMAIVQAEMDARTAKGMTR